MKYLIAILLVFYHFTGYSQIQPTIPAPSAFQPVSGITPNSTTTNNTQSAINQQNNQIISADQESGNQRQKPLDEIRKDVAEQNRNNPHQEIPAEAKPFYDAYSALNKMSMQDYSLNDAVYTVENAYYNNSYSKTSFDNSLKARTELCKQILKREHLPANNNLAINYAIQKLYQQDNKYYNSKTGKTTTIPRLKYDFNDFMGDTSYAQMFVTKLFATNKGQCHSLPLLYLLLAEQLGGKAYLSLAPEHSYIRFADTAGRLYNFETTSGVLVSDKFEMQSGFINVTAIKNKSYMDTLSKKQLLAYCLADLEMEYVSKFGYDDFVERIINRILQLYPNSIQGNIMLGNLLTAKAMTAIKQAGYPKPEDLYKYPKLYSLHQAMLKQYDVTDALGYQEMPKDAYEQWLKEVQAQRDKQEAEELQEQFNYQLQLSRLKN
jgi:hypothetical protein